jgi:integrase
MAFIKNNGRDSWQAAIDLQGVRKKKTFPTKTEAKAWADQTEAAIRMNGIIASDVSGTIGELVTRYEKEMYAHRRWGDTKTYNLDQIKKQIGSKPLKHLNKQLVIKYGMELAETRGQNGVKERLSYLSKVLKTASALWDIPLQPQITAVREGMFALRETGVSGDAVERTRRLSEEEIDKVRRFATRTEKSVINLPAIIDVLRVLPIRLGELCSIEWADLDARDRSVLLRKRKHPTKKETNDERVALPVVAGVDTYALIAGRPRVYDKPFPYTPKSISTLAWLATKQAGVDNMHLHDLRSHSISFLLGNGVSPAVVAAISGHKDLRTMMKHYARLQPDQVHASIERAGAHDKARKGNVVNFAQAA